MRPHNPRNPRIKANDPCRVYLMVGDHSFDIRFRTFREATERINRAIARQPLSKHLHWIMTEKAQ